MDRTVINEFVAQFCSESHGASNYGKETVFVRGKNKGEYVPLVYLKKKVTDLSEKTLLENYGFNYNSYSVYEDHEFESWYEKQFSKKLPLKHAKTVTILFAPTEKNITESLEVITKAYDKLREEKILLNSKNLPVQLGEWYAKCIFGLNQIKSSSQRGFDFQIKSQQVEVKVHWAQKTGHKGLKLRKSLVELSKYCILIYVSKDFLIKDICFLDSDFILRKFPTKGPTIFLKETDVGPYFFSKSTKHFDKIVNKATLMKFATPQLALKLDGPLLSSQSHQNNS